MPYSEEEIEEIAANGYWFRSVLAMVTTGPDEEVSQDIKDECEALVASNPTEAVCYDKLIELSQSTEATTSPFLKGICGVDDHYPRPSD